MEALYSLIWVLSYVFLFMAGALMTTLFISQHIDRDHYILTMAKLGIPIIYNKRATEKRISRYLGLTSFLFVVCVFLLTLLSH